MMHYKFDYPKLTLDLHIYGTEEDLYRFDADDKKTTRVVACGYIAGDDVRSFAIVNNGRGFPVAYIALLRDDYIQKFEPAEMVARYDMLSWVHGGGTYMGKAYWDESDPQQYVGWDYHHSGDFYNSPDNNSTPKADQKKWTIWDIFEECGEAAKQLWDMNKNPEKYSAYVKEPKPTLDRIAKVIEESIEDADKLNQHQQDDTYYRGWKNAMQSVLTILNNYDKPEKEENKNEDH